MQIFRKIFIEFYLKKNLKINQQKYTIRLNKKAKIDFLKVELENIFIKKNLRGFYHLRKKLFLKYPCTKTDHFKKNLQDENN